MIVLGLAFALTYGPLTIAATDDVEPQEQGVAGGLLNTAFQFGAAIGLSVAAAVNVAFLPATISPRTTLDAFHAALLVPLAMAVLAALVTAFGLRRATLRTSS